MNDALFDLPPSAKDCLIAGHLLNALAALRSGAERYPPCGASWTTAHATDAGEA